MCTTDSITSILGYPKDLWTGRSFIDFVHPSDRRTFTSQITSGISLPFGNQLKVTNQRAVGGANAPPEARVHTAADLVDLVWWGLVTKFADIWVLQLMLQMELPDITTVRRK